MTWTMYLSSFGVESQVGPSSGDVIYFMKRKFRRCAIFIQPHTHYAGQTDTFECFFRGVKVKMKRTETALLLLLMMDGLYGGSHSAELHGEKRGWT